MKRNNHADLNFYLFIVISIWMGLFFGSKAFADVKIILLDEKTVAKVPISPKGTAIAFPSKPDEITLGQKGQFNTVFIENDLIVSPNRSDSRVNLFVYLFGKRYTLDLYTSAQYGKTIVIIKDKGSTNSVKSVKSGG